MLAFDDDDVFHTAYRIELPNNHQCAATEGIDVVPHDRGERIAMVLED